MVRALPPLLIVRLVTWRRREGGGHPCAVSPLLSRVGHDEGKEMLYAVSPLVDRSPDCVVMCTGVVCGEFF